MKIKEILDTLITECSVEIYERRQYNGRIYINLLFKDANPIHIRLDKNVLQREVTMLAANENTLFIVTDGDEDET